MEKNISLPSFYQDIMQDMINESYTEPELDYHKVGDISFIRLLMQIEKETKDTSYFSDLSLNELNTFIKELDENVRETLYQEQKSKIKPVLDKTGIFIIKKMSYKMAFNFLNEWNKSCELKNEDAMELEKILYRIFSKEPTEQTFKDNQQTLKNYLNKIKDKYNNNNSKKMPDNYFMQFNSLCNANNLDDFKDVLKNEFYNQTKLLILKQNDELTNVYTNKLENLEYPKGTRSFSNNAVFFRGSTDTERDKAEQFANDINKNGNNKTKINARVHSIKPAVFSNLTNDNIFSVTLDFNTATNYAGCGHYDEFTGIRFNFNDNLIGNITISTQPFSDSYYSTILDTLRWNSFRELIVTKQNQHDLIGNLILDHKNSIYTFKLNENFFPRNKEEQKRLDDITNFFKTPKNIEEITSHFNEYNRDDILAYNKIQKEVHDKCKDWRGCTDQKDMKKFLQKLKEGENKKILRHEYNEIRKNIMPISDKNVKVEQFKTENIESARQPQQQTNPELQQLSKLNKNPQPLPVQNNSQPLPVQNNSQPDLKPRKLLTLKERTQRDIDATITKHNKINKRKEEEEKDGKGDSDKYRKCVLLYKN